MTNAPGLSRQPLSGPFAWTGAEIAASTSWRHELDANLIEEINAGIEAYAASGRPWQEANSSTFPLTGLEGLTTSMREELETGSGIFQLRGVPVERHTPEQMRAFFLALGDHVGMPVSQSLKGERLMAIEDAGENSGDYGTITDSANEGSFRSSRARAFSTAGLRFHTDRCDVVALLCLSQARHGGHSKIASAVAIHNALLERAPDLLAELFTDYPRSRFGEEESDASTHYMLPVFTLEHGKFATHYSRTYIEAAQMNPDVPRLRDAQNAALDILADMAGELCYEMTLQSGDVQFLNNHVIYHARDTYQDDPANGYHRSLLRLWLAMPDSRPLAPSFEVLFGSTQPGTIRGGIWPEGQGPGIGAPA